MEGDVIFVAERNLTNAPGSSVADKTDISVPKPRSFVNDSKNEEPDKIIS
jgi:hypothetical protein